MSLRGVPTVATVATVCLALLVVMSGCAAAPLLGAALFSSLLNGFDAGSNGTSALGLVALSHLQHKIDTLSQLAELLSLGGNVTQSFLVK